MLTKFEMENAILSGDFSVLKTKAEYSSMEYIKNVFQADDIKTRDFDNEDLILAGDYSILIKR